MNVAAAVLLFVAVVLRRVATAATAFITIAPVGPITGRGGGRRRRRRTRFETSSVSSQTQRTAVTTSEEREDHAEITPNPLLFDNKRDRLLRSLLSAVQAAVDEETFRSFTVRGPSKRAAARLEKERGVNVRGCLRLVAGRPISVKGAEKLHVTFKYHGATDVVKNWLPGEAAAGLESIFYVGKPSPSFWQASEWGVSAVQDAALGTPQGLQSAVVETVDTRWELQLVGDKPSLRKKTLKQTATADQTTAQQQRHDRTKQTPLNRRADFWEALGVTDSNGNVKRGMQSKYKQCQKFVELTSRLIRQDSRHDIEVMDMGCGRGYLTFALHSWLHQRYGDAVSSRGIDVRPKLVKEMNGIVERLGPTFAGLTFDVGTIESFLLEQETTAPSSSAVKMLIALHACDTATDDALWSGISSNADVLVVAPCCHKQVRPQLDRHAAAVAREHPLADVLRHGIYRERIAETVTDSIRALLLELAGYAVQVFEFVGGEHTSKNVMITAVKTDEKRQPADQKDQLRQRIRSLAALHGIREQKLATWMGESLVVEGGKKKLGAELSVKNMPPLKSGVEQRTD